MNAEIIEDDDDLWRRLAAVPLSEEVKETWRATVLTAQLPGFLQSVGNDFLWQAGVGDGHVSAVHRTSFTSEQLNQIRIAAINAGGTLSRGLPGTSSSSQQLGQRIKQELDPNGVFPSMCTVDHQ